MNLSYDEFMAIVPKETAEYVKTVLEELYCHFDISYDVNEFTGKYNKFVKSFLCGMLSQNKYGNFLRDVKFDGSQVSVYRVDINEKIYRRMYNDFISMFCIKNNVSDYKYLMPSELLYNAVKLKEDNESYEKFYNSIGVNKNLKSITRNLVKQDRELIDLQIENEIFKGMDYEQISYFECASKIRGQLIKKFNSHAISECDYLKNIDEYLIPISLFLAIFEYDGKNVNAIEKYLNDKGITINKIYEMIGYDLSNDVSLENRNMQAIDNLYKSYFSKDVQEVFEKLLNRDMVNNTCIERLLSKFNLKLENFSNMKDDLVKYVFNPEEERKREISEFYGSLKVSTKDYLNETSKIYQILKKYIGTHELLNTDDDICCLTLLISSYYNDGILCDYFIDNGIEFDDILGLLNISITEDEIKNTLVDKNIVMSKFKRFVDEGNNKGSLLSYMYPSDIEKNLCSKEFNRSTIIHDLFDKFTGKTLDAYFIDKLEKHIDLKRRMLEEMKIKDYMKNLPIEDKEFLGYASSKYLELKNYNKDFLNDDFLVELSLIYACEMVPDCCEYLKNINLSYNSLLLHYTIRDNYNKNNYLNVDVLNEKFSDLVHDGEFPMDIMLNMLNDKNMSLMLREFLYKNNIKVISREEFDINMKQATKEKELYKKIDRFDRDIQDVIKTGRGYYPYINDKYSDEDKKYISLFLGLFFNEDFCKILNSKGITYDCLKDKLLSGEVSFNNIKMSDVFYEFKLVDTNDFSRETFINKLLDNDLIKKICGTQFLSLEELKYELINKKSYEDSLSIIQKKEILEQVDLPELNPFSNTSLLRYSNALNFHSKNIEGPYNELVKSDTITNATNSIHDTINSLYVEKEVDSKQGFFSKLFSGNKEVKKEIELNPDAMEKLRKDLQASGLSLENEIKVYGDLLEYMRAFYNKNKLRIEEVEKQIEMLKAQKSSFSEDDTIELIRFQSALDILESYKNSFLSTDALFRTEILKVYNAIVSHFMVLNSIRTTKETLVPIIESEGIIGKGINNERDVITVVHEISSLFTNLVMNNSEGISENLSNLNNCNLSLENYQSLVNGVNRFMSEASVLTTNPVSSTKEDNKVYLNN